jgi:tricorn protease
MRRADRFAIPRGRQPETILRSACQREGSGFSSLYIWNAADNKLNRVTDDMFNAGSPVWDPTGSYLYFASQREFAPQISNIEFNYATNAMCICTRWPLRKDVKNPVPG